MKTTLGGDRIGSGNKNEITTRHYDRSTHDQSGILRTTASVGTLIPFMTELGLPGTNFEIDLNCEVMTLPTIGPLFGSMKVQLDVYQIPIRLYHKELMYNKTKVGLKMADILLPQLQLVGKELDNLEPLDNQQINPSSIFSYLNIRGMGQNKGGSNANGQVIRRFNAIPYLAYWDIYKNYYSNKQEEVGYVIHNELENLTIDVDSVKFYELQGGTTLSLVDTGGSWNQITFTAATRLEIGITGGFDEFDISRLTINTKLGDEERWSELTRFFSTFTWSPTTNQLIASNPVYINGYYTVKNWEFDQAYQEGAEPKLLQFKLESLDELYENIMSQNTGTPFVINAATIEPFNAALDQYFDAETEKYRYSATSNQEGLGIKTYQSDLFNNWISSEWLDGANGVNEVTSIQIVDDEFTINEFIMKKKIFDMLNNINLSGGTLEDWIEAVYDEKPSRRINSPVYEGGLSKELVFQSVISNTQTEQQPLGTLAGRGTMAGKHKGGKIKIQCDEPSYIMGIFSITPRIDYSQGNKWDVNLKTMDDLHKPPLDQIAFQELITDQMAWWDTQVLYNDVTNLTTTEYNSAGKQPAWINYTTNVNYIKGNFAIEGDSGFMVLNRNYEPALIAGEITIGDLTTYIDPKKYNNIFAETRRDAQNYWVQIGYNITSRRKMAAKQIPNL